MDSKALKKQVEDLQAELARVRAQLAAADEYRDTLLAELQHQVRNNLQVILAMFSLHRERQAADLEVIGSRIEALRGIYNKMYLVDHHSEVDFGAYLLELCSSLMRFHSASSKNITIDTECENLRVMLNKSVPLGLICNEFIMNSMRHAFVDGRGRVVVTLKATDEAHGTLSLADDGVGFKPDAVEHDRHRGLSIMKRLATQADTEIVWEDGGSGTRCSMVINARKPTAEETG